MKKIFTLAFLLLVTPILLHAQTGVKKRRPLPFEYGRILISTPNLSPDLPDVQFDHWLHRAKYTCRLCHVDIGFAMKRNATGIKAEDNIKGYYCGTCHNGKMIHGDRTVFGACAKTYTEDELRSRCRRCHSVGEKVKAEYDFGSFTGTFPKERMPEALAAADICVAILRDIPMFRTTYPNKVFDYMAAGRPIQIQIVNSPDGAFVKAVDSATGRQQPTTMVVDGRQVVATVG